MNAKDTNTTAGNKLTVKDDDQEFKNLLKQYEITLIVYVLKRVTDIDHAISCSELANHLNMLLPSDTDKDFFNTRTTSRKIDLIDSISNDSGVFLNKLNDIFTASFGGRIRARETDSFYYNRASKGKGTQKRYYFEPLLKSSDMELIYGSLRSNRYLSENEKQFLMSRLELLHPGYNRSQKDFNYEHKNGINNIEALPDEPQSMDTTNLPGHDSKFIRTAQTIYDAIQKDAQIEVMYGVYDMKPNSMKVDFHERNRNGEPYILNPYGLLWNDGEYYMVANSESYHGVTHYRIDRIISVKIHTTRTEAGEVIYARRSPVPKELVDFYEKDYYGHVYFNGIKYANTYPNMAIYKENRRIHCTFECTNIALSMLVDNFGPDIRLQKSPYPHDPSEVDLKGNPQEFLLATINNVQYDNVKRFALNHSQYLTLTAPEYLVAEVYEALNASADKLKQHLPK